MNVTPYPPSTPENEHGAPKGKTGGNFPSGPVVLYGRAEAHPHKTMSGMPGHARQRNADDKAPANDTAISFQNARNFVRSDDNRDCPTAYWKGYDRH